MAIHWRETYFKCAAFMKNGAGRATAIGILLLGISGCSSLEPIAEPEVSDLQLMADTLKSSLRDAQRTIAELRVEADAQRQELADVQIAKAQLEGQVREAERRLTEARHVIDLQREELAGTRSERERMGRTGAALQNQLKQLQKQLARAGEPVKGHVSPAAVASPQIGQPQLVTGRVERESFLTDGEERTGVLPQQASPMSDAASVGEILVDPQPSTRNTPVRMSIKPGDTLWDIGRRFHISVERLMAINALPNDRIRVGQTLWLTEPSTGEPEHERM